MEHLPVLPLDLWDIQHGEVIDGVACKSNDIIRQKVKGESYDRFSSVIEKHL